MTTRLTGQDSVDPAGMHSGLDVYCGYDSGAPGYRNGSFSNMAAIRARFPGKRYLSVGYDCIDVEPGLASPGEAPAFVRNWTRHNTAKPVVYANASQMPSVKSALNAAGIPRDHYFLWLAEWDGNPAIPFGYDGKQYASTQGYDSDSFWDYVFTGATPPAPNSWPLQQGSAGPAVTSLQNDLNHWAHVIGLATPLTADGSFGALTAAAVKLAQAHLGQAATGIVSQALWNVLQGTVPGPPPPPPEFPVPVSLSATPRLQLAMSWAPGSPLSPHWRVQVAADDAGKPGAIVTAGQVTVPAPHAIVTLPRPGKYWWRVQAAGDGAFTPWKPVTA